MILKYTKRIKTKESKGISTLLVTSAKKQFLGDAYFFAVVNKTINTIFENNYPKLVDDLKLCEIFVKHSEDNTKLHQSRGSEGMIKITIQSSDISFLTWLKTESEDIREGLSKILNEKKLLKENYEVLIVAKRK